MTGKIIIGSRESRLAVIQSEMVQAYIQREHPELSVRILTMKTTGDKILNQSLEKIGGKGLFVKELDAALMEGRSDLSVHSLKDVPMDVPEEMPLVAYSAREDVRDVLVLPKGVSELDFSKPIGCSSKRRMYQFALLYPQARFAPIRGNVQTRLNKVDSGAYAATILAAAGLKRLGLQERISRYFDTEEMIPAAGQGILAVQGRAGEEFGYLKGYSDSSSEACARAERALVRTLQGSCTTPVAAYAQISPDGSLNLRAFYFDEEAGRYHRGTISADPGRAAQAGASLAELFLSEEGYEAETLTADSGRLRECPEKRQ